jgi:hypothetical protein
MNHDSVWRTLPILGHFALVLGMTCISGCFLNSLAQTSTNPVPLINNPLVPSTVAPGGPAFTLTVNGTGFVSGAVASWNGSPRTTTFVSSSQVTVSIAASDVAKAGTATVTVGNPGGIASLPVFFHITSPTSAVGFALAPNNLGDCPNLVGDFNGDGKMDLVACNGSVITVLLGIGDGTFNALTPISNPAMVCPLIMVATDLNNDGKTDLVGVGTSCTAIAEEQLIVLLGNGDGTFQQPVLSPFSLGLNKSPATLAVADFNGDGRLDLALTFPTDGTDGPPGQIYIFLGNGDGTLQSPIIYGPPSLDCSSGTPNCVSAPDGLAIGDFNGDGKLDLAVCGYQGIGIVSILLGNGDGTFQAPQPIGSFSVSALSANYVASADLTGDGKLDLVVAGHYVATVFLGNGDGTFGAGMTFTTPPTEDSGQPILSDINGDGKLDLALSLDTGISILLGNGDGTFQPHTDVNFSLGGLFQLGAGDFNQDGRLDLVVSEGVLVQTTAQVSTFSVSFGNQNDGTTSTSQSVTLTNLASSELMLNSVAITGTNSGDFAIQSNTCGTAVPAGTSCTVGITFTPAAKGARSASLLFTDGATASPQMVALTGTGIGTAPPAVSLAPKSLTFPAQPVSTSSSQMTVTLTNTGDLGLTVNGIVFQGANPGDFTQTNNCSDVAGGTSCSINVTFTPGASGSRSATMQIVDNTANSPQPLAVSGTGSAPTLGLVVPSGSPSSATVQAGAMASYTLAIGGGGMSGTASLACTGAPMGAVCSVPTTISVASTTASNFTVNVTTTSRTLSALRLIEQHPGSWAWSALFLGIAIRPRASRRKRALLRLAWLMPLAVSLCACGGGGGGNSTNPNGTPAGTYTLTVTATLGSTNQSVNLTLIVQ